MAGQPCALCAVVPHWISNWTWVGEMASVVVADHLLDLYIRGAYCVVASSMAGIDHCKWFGSEWKCRIRLPYVTPTWWSVERMGDPG